MSTLENCKIQISRMKAILEEETSLLRDGKLPSLAVIATEKLKIMSTLEQALSQLKDQTDIAAVAPYIESIKRSARENGVRLETIMNGVKSAQDRLKSLENASAKVGAYNRAGTRLFLSEEQVNSEKRI